MPVRFDHERLHAYQKALAFCAWVTPVLESVPAKFSARDQLDRASTSNVLNLAEGNGKRSYRDRSRFFDIARGSVVECAACLDVLVARGVLALGVADEGKAVLRELVAMVAGLLDRFAGDGMVCEEQTAYGLEAEAYANSHTPLAELDERGGERGMIKRKEKDL